MSTTSRSSPSPTTTTKTKSTATSMAPSRLPRGPWGLAGSIALAVVGLLGIYVLPMLPGLVIPLEWADGARVATEKSLLLVVPLLLVVALCRPIGGRALGTHWPGWRPILIWAVGGTISLNVASILWDRIKGAEPMGDQLKQLGFGHSVGQDVLVVLAIAVIAPVAEEFIFRAFLHRGVRDTLARWVRPSIAIGVATAVSTWLFVEIHGTGNQTTMVPLYVLYGLVTAISYEATGSLLAPVIIHTATNGYAVMQGLRDLSAAGESPAWLIGLAVLAPVIGVALTVGLGRVLSLVGGERSTPATESAPARS